MPDNVTISSLSNFVAGTEAQADGSHRTKTLTSPLIRQLTGSAITRPANTTEYTQGVGVMDTGSPGSGNAVYKLAGVSRGNSLFATLTGISLFTNQKTSTLQTRVHLFNAAPTILADNVALQWNYDTSHQGYVDMAPLETFTGAATGGAFRHEKLLNLDVLSSVANELWWLIECRSFMTVATNIASQQFTPVFTFRG